MKAFARFFLKRGTFGRFTLIVFLLVALFYIIEFAIYLMNLASTIGNLGGLLITVFAFFLYGDFSWTVAKVAREEKK